MFTRNRNKAFSEAIKSGNFHKIQYELNKGSDINVKVDSGQTPLHLAVKNQDLSTVQFLCNKGAHSHLVSEDGVSSLELALSMDNTELIKCLLENGADPNIELRNGFIKGARPLHLAVYNKDTDLIDCLLSHRALVDLTDEEGRTPLHMATQYGSCEVVNILLEGGAKINEGDHLKLTALHIASQEGQFDIAKVLIDRGADIKSEDTLGCTSLHYAKNKEVADLILDHGADPNESSKSGETPLHMAARRSDSDVIEVLLSRGADLNCRDHKNRLPIFWVLSEPKSFHHFFYDSAFDRRDIIIDVLSYYVATPFQRVLPQSSNTQESITSRLKGYCGEIESFKKLLAEKSEFFEPKDKNKLFFVALQNKKFDILDQLLLWGADLNVQDDNDQGNTLLHKSTIDLSGETTQFLIERGADSVYVNQQGETALHLAAQRGNQESISLLRAFIPRNDVDNRYKTPLRHAVDQGHFEAAQLLLHYGADPKISDMYNSGPLHILASQTGTINTVNLILDTQPDLIDQKDKWGRTALYCAAQCGQLEMVEYLVDRGADIKICNKEDLAPLDIAIQYDFKEIAHFLLEKGAQENRPCFKDGVTALHRAILFDRSWFIELYLAKGMDPNVLNLNEDSLLFLAAAANKTNITRLLLKHKTDPNLVNQQGWGPLHMTAVFQNDEIETDLLKAGADQYIESRCGLRPVDINGFRLGSVEGAYPTSLLTNIDNLKKKNNFSNQKGGTSQTYYKNMFSKYPRVYSNRPGFQSILSIQSNKHTQRFICELEFVPGKTVADIITTKGVCSESIDLLDQFLDWARQYLYFEVEPGYYYMADCDYHLANIIYHNDTFTRIDYLSNSGMVYNGLSLIYYKIFANLLVFQLSYEDYRDLIGRLSIPEEYKEFLMNVGGMSTTFSQRILFELSHSENDIYYNHFSTSPSVCASYNDTLLKDILINRGQNVGKNVFSQEMKEALELRYQVTKDYHEKVIVGRASEWKWTAPGYTPKKPKQIDKSAIVY